MRLTVDAGALADAIKSAGACTAKGKVQVPILQNVHIEASAGRLSVTTTNLDQQAQSTVEAEIEEPGAVTVDAARASAFFRSGLSGPARLEFGDDGRLHVSAGRARARLATLPAGDFPFQSVASDGAAVLRVTGDDFARRLSRVGFCASREETRYYLNGVVIEAGAGSAVMTATDGYRLASITFDSDAVIAPSIMPRVALGDIEKMCARAGKGEVRLTFDGNRVEVAHGNETYLTKLIDGTFPDWRRLLRSKSGDDVSAVISPDAASRAVSQVITLADDRASGVRLIFDGSRLNVRLNQPDAACETDLECESTGEARLSVNGRYLIELLQRCPPNAPALISSPEGAPLQIEPDDREWPLQLLMGIRGVD